MIKHTTQSILRGTTRNVGELGCSADNGLKIRLDPLENHGDAGFAKGIEEADGAKVFGFGAILPSF